MIEYEINCVFLSNYVILYIFFEKNLDLMKKLSTFAKCFEKELITNNTCFTKTCYNKQSNTIEKKRII